MSSPDTNVEKQKQRHRGPLVGMAIAAIFGIGLILLWVFGVFATAPETDDAAVDGAGAQSEEVIPVEPEGTIDPDSSEAAEPAADDAQTD